MKKIVALVFLLNAAIAVAGGPIAVGSGTFGQDGKPFVWDTTNPIRYTTDGGLLGTLTNTQANTHVQNMFQTWALPTDTLAFSRVGAIQGVADGDVNTVAEYDAVVGTCQAGTQTPVIYDADGTLFTALGYPDAVLGFAGPCAISSSGKIITGQAVLNGDNPTDWLDATMVHEFGHLLGLDHSIVPCANGCEVEDAFALPTMFPILFNPADTMSLAPDDIAWISRLYPSGSFAASYGKVSGHVYFSDGVTPIQDVLVVLRRVDDPNTAQDESRRIAFSVISGYQFTGIPGQHFSDDYLPCVPASACTGGTAGWNGASEFGSANPALIGTWDMFVTPGTYAVAVQSALTGYGPDFDTLGPLSPVIAMPAPSEFWNQGESDTDDVAASSTIVVGANANVISIDIILNGTPGRFDQFEKSEIGAGVRSGSSTPTAYFVRRAK
jgi:hypothetical protein